MGLLFTDKETREKREQICNSCESKKNKGCLECGCYLLFLKKIQTATCPRNKW